MSRPSRTSCLQRNDPKRTVRCGSRFAAPSITSRCGVSLQWEAPQTAARRRMSTKSLTTKVTTTTTTATVTVTVTMTATAAATATIGPWRIRAYA
ncbi:unnamed protein product [Closterium sp. NIES-53]